MKETEAYKEERSKAGQEQAEREEQEGQFEEQTRPDQLKKEPQEKEETEHKEAAEVEAEVENKAETDEIHQKKERSKKTAKRTGIIAAAVVLVAVLVYVTGWQIIPSVRYQNANKALEAQSFDEAYDAFVALGNYKDSVNKLTDTVYQKGIFLMNSGLYLDAAAEFDRVSYYQDSSDQAVFCRNEATYLDAKALFEAGNYTEAADVFASISEYSDSAEQVNASNYMHAQELLKNGEYIEAAAAFDALSKYSDSAEQANASNYLYAQELLESGKYEDSHTAFKALSDYEDSKDLADESYYRLAAQFFDAKKYHEAYSYFNGLSSYKDSGNRANESEYLYAIECFDSGKLGDAVTAFNHVEDYKDVPDRLSEAKYQYALELITQSNWSKASNLFNQLGDYQDSASRYQQTLYQYGLQLLNDKSYNDAVVVFDSLGSYQESAAKLNEAKYGYVSTHKSRTDTTTYAYLTELKAARYEDSAEIYTSLYAWKITAVINDSENNSLTSKSSISKSSTIYCHIKLSGGPPDGNITLKATTISPNGSTGSYQFDEAWHDGSTGYFATYYENPASISAGDLRIRISDNATGELLGEYTVSLTNPTWKEAYLDFINNSPLARAIIKRNYGKFYLIDFDNDGTPELLIDAKSADAGLQLCTYKDGNVEYISMLWAGTLYYIPQEGRLMYEGSNSGQSITEVLQIQNGTITTVAYGIVVFGNGDNQENTYSWNGVTMAPEFFMTNLLNAFYSDNILVANEADKGYSPTQITVALS